MINKTLILFLLIVAFAFSSCSNYDKLLKSADIEKKYEAAIKYYEKENYVKALTLLEELVAVFRGTAKAESILFYYAYSNYNIGDYVLASYHFKNFVRTYPNSVHAEECSYLAAYCYYLTSPIYSLDQEDTRLAIQEFQSFVNTYPQSLRVASANEMVDKLRRKLEKKTFEIAKQYYNIGDYKASSYAFKNTLNEFPDTQFREEISYLIVKSNYLLAINSIDSKKDERLKATIDSYQSFVDRFTSSGYLKEAESIYESALKLREKTKSKTTS